MKGKLSFLHAKSLFFFGCLIMLVGLALVVYYFTKESTFVASDITILGFIVLIFGFAMIVWFLKVILRIEIKNGQLLIKKELTERVIDKSEIESIDLLIIRGDSIGFNVLLTDDENIFFNDDHYSNIYQIKQELLKQFPSKIISTLNYPKQEAIINLIIPEKFSGLQLLSFFGILFYGLVCFLLWVVLNGSLNYIETIAMIFVLFFFYLLLGYHMCYFIFNEEKLVIKNQFWFWYRKEYDLTNILVVIFVVFGRDTNALKILTKIIHQKFFLQEV